HPVQLGPARLHDRDAGVGRELDRLAEPLVTVQPRADVQGRGGHVLAQRLQDGVAAGDDLGRAARPAGRRAAARTAGSGPSRVSRGTPAAPAVAAAGTVTTGTVTT